MSLDVVSACSIEFSRIRTGSESVELCRATASDSNAFDNGDQDINRDSDPDLGLDGVFGSSVKRLDPEMLFDPFEKQFPPASDTCIAWRS